MDDTIKSFFNEEWKLIKHKHKTKTIDYYVSNYGRIKGYSKRFKQWKLVKGSKDKRGLYGVSYRSTENVNVRLFIHKYVAEYWVEQPSKDHIYLIHKDKDKTNNHFKNLMWMEKREWIQELKDRGVFTPAPDKKFGRHVKMTPAKVALLKRSLLNGKTRKKMLAKRFGITHTQLNRIESGENWGHIDPAPVEKLKH